jgi:hypothetical protein
MLPALWLRSDSHQQITTPLYPRQVPIRPTVYYTETAWYKLQYLIRNNTKEVGWWGTVLKNGDTYTIEDIFVPKQVVTSATTEISPEGLAEVAIKLMEKQGHADNLLYWGHLHPNFAVTPSSTDERTTQEYLETFDAPAYFIRGIYNKQGESKVDVYIKDTVQSGWVHQSVTNTRVPIYLSDSEYRQFTAEIKLNVAEKVVVPQRQPTGNYPVPKVGSFTRILPANTSGVYRQVEGTSGLPVAAREMLSDLDPDELDDVVTYEDLSDPFLVKGERGYDRD